MFPFQNQNAQQQPTPPLYPIHFTVPDPPDQSRSTNADLTPASQFIPSYPQAAQDNLLESYRTIAPRNFARYQDPYGSSLFHDDRAIRNDFSGAQNVQASNLNIPVSHPEAPIAIHMHPESSTIPGNITQAVTADGQLHNPAHNRNPSRSNTDLERSLLASSHPKLEQTIPATRLPDHGGSQCLFSRGQHQFTLNPNLDQASPKFFELERRQTSPEETQIAESTMIGSTQFIDQTSNYTDAWTPTHQVSLKPEQPAGLALTDLANDPHQTQVYESQTLPIPGTSSHINPAPTYSHMPRYPAPTDRPQSENTTPAQLHGVSVVDDSFDHTKESSAPSTAGVHKLTPGVARELAEPEPETFTSTEKLELLVLISPLDVAEYARHLYALASLILADAFELTEERDNALKRYESLLDDFDVLELANTYSSTIHIVVERNFDVFIRIATTYTNMNIANRTIRFLTIAIMSLNYWEIYNLLLWKPAIYHFMVVINFDFEECYASFMRNYSKFQKAASETANVLPNMLTSQPIDQANDDTRRGTKRPASKRSARKKRKSLNPGVADTELNEKRKRTRDPDSERDQMIKRRMGIKRFKLSNYDPDVIHECQLPSPEEPHKLCLRRFSRKYELTRHQETVHSKKKKLYKCFVCIKDSPGVGPRIFTRHDTLAKHIRVNHKMIGNDAKAQVAYSKRNAEIVEEGDITVHVGRRKTKVDFELRAHMQKRHTLRDDDENESFETSDLESGDEEVVLLK